MDEHSVWTTGVDINKKDAESPSDQITHAKFIS